jgi:rhomboid protease GluP
VTSGGNPDRAAQRGAILTVAGLVAFPELILQGADLQIWGNTLWRTLSYQYGAFWAGLLHGWTPNYAAQPATMFLTHAVLHSGFGHMVGNVLGILTLGALAIGRLGRGWFLAICLLAVLSGALVFGLLTRSPQPMVGASGLVFGLAGIWAWGLADDRRRAGQGWGRALWSVFAVTAALAMFNLIGFVILQGILAWETHLGGYLAGLLAAVLATRSARS